MAIRSKLPHTENVKARRVRIPVGPCSVRQLSVGRYQLKISVRDEKSRAEAEASLEFEMVADPSLTTAQVSP